MLSFLFCTGSLFSTEFEIQAYVFLTVLLLVMFCPVFILQLMQYSFFDKCEIVKKKVAFI